MVTVPCIINKKTIRSINNIYYKREKLRKVMKPIDDVKMTKEL